MTTETPSPDFRREVKREDRRWNLIGALAVIAGIEALVIGGMSLEVLPAAQAALDGSQAAKAAAEDTAAAVELLEGRTPLFGELQATEDRIVCISEIDAVVSDRNAALSEALATGLAAVATSDDEALAAAGQEVVTAIAELRTARARLGLIGTDQDPCTRR